MNENMTFPVNYDNFPYTVLTLNKFDSTGEVDTVETFYLDKNPLDIFREILKYSPVSGFKGCDFHEKLTSEIIGQEFAVRISPENNIRDKSIGDLSDFLNKVEEYSIKPPTIGDFLNYEIIVSLRKEKEPRICVNYSQIEDILNATVLKRFNTYLVHDS